LALEVYNSISFWVTCISVTELLFEVMALEMQ